MGRRKSKRGPGPKRKALQPLETMFNCPFCNHEKSCEVKMEKTRNTGRIQCNVCMEDFQVRQTPREAHLEVSNVVFAGHHQLLV